MKSPVKSHEIPGEIPWNPWWNPRWNPQVKSIPNSAMVHCQKPRFSKGTTGATGLLRPEIHGAAMVCHGSHQEIPPLWDRIYTSTSPIRHGYVKCEIQRKSWYINYKYSLFLAWWTNAILSLRSLQCGPNMTQSVSSDKKTQVDYWSNNFS